MKIELQNISKTFGKFQALKNITLTIPSGELVALLGPSGSGKTTLLRMIAGLEMPDSGSGNMLFDGEDVRRRPISERNVGFVFQHYALFHHMNVFNNIAFGLNVRPKKQRPSKKFIESKVNELLKLIHLGGLANRFPHQLSGGQRQRVALARALAVEPQVLLLDEPFGALDAKVRLELRRWLRRLHDEIGITSVFVTHDQDEALDLADRVAVLNHGQIEQVGTPYEIFHQPKTEFVLNFLGNVNFFHGSAGDGKVVLGKININAPQFKDMPIRPAHVFVRPHQFDLDSEAKSGKSMPATVTRIHTAGSFVRLELVTENGEAIQADIMPEKFADLCIDFGSTVHVHPKEYMVFLQSDTKGYEAEIKDKEITEIKKSRKKKIKQTK
jgi:sulfate transport system ATP-binding protein